MVEAVEDGTEDNGAEEHATCPGDVHGGHLLRPGGGQTLQV